MKKSDHGILVIVVVDTCLWLGMVIAWAWAVGQAILP